MAGFLKKLFGGGAGPAPTTKVEHEGYVIEVDPMPEGSRWRIAATITKGEKTHRMVRADVVDARELAEEATLRKAKSLVEQQGDGIFL